MSAFKQYAARLIDMGYSPVPILPGSKMPLPSCRFYAHWNELRGHALSFEQVESIARWRPHLGLGVAGGYNCLVPTDTDTIQPAIQRAIRDALPKSSVSKMGAKGWTDFFWDQSGLIEAVKFREYKERGFDTIAEVLVTGQSLLPPTIHPETLLPYKWLTEATLFNTPIDQLPVITVDHIKALRVALKPWLPDPSQNAVRLKHAASIKADDRMHNYARVALRKEAERLSMLSTGRNWGLFAAACKLGKFVHNGAIPQSVVENTLMQATKANGYAAARHGGVRQAWKTLHSGLKKSCGDVLPNLDTSLR